MIYSQPALIPPMHTSSRQRFISRQYRLANGILTLGALSAGLLVLQGLVMRLHDSFLRFYGVSEEQFTGGLQVPGWSLSFTQLTIAVIGVVGIAGFIVNERVRSRRLLGGRRVSAISIERPNIRDLVSAYVIRVSIFSGIMLLVWILQASFISASAGFGWGVTDGGLKAALPLVSIFGLCVLVGLAVAGISMIGLRVMSVLEEVLFRLLRAPRRRQIARGPVWTSDESVSIRSRFGLEILSRPPPVAA